MAEEEGRRRRKKGGGEHQCETAGGLRWLITYADMITLLLGVFIILVGAGGISETKFKAMATAFSRFFSIFEGGGEKKIEKGEIRGGSAERKGYRIAGVSVFNQRFIEQIERGFSEERTLGMLSILPTKEGIKISIQDRLFFKEGSIKILVSSEKTLGRIVEMLSGIDNRIIIEAHTNNMPPKDFSSNWELSSKRALAVFDSLVDVAKEKGTDEEGMRRRIRIVGLSDTKPAILSDPSSPKNNRIEIIILEK
ncbi:TPA: hypothetical protein DCX16_03050 [bacterium]|nr:hypothetical protein [bacterium]